VPTCLHCHKEYAEPNAQDHWFRRAGFCSKSCLKGHLRPFIPGELKRQRFPRKFWCARLDDFQSRSEHETDKDKWLRRYAENIPDQGLLLTGARGVGKTYRAIALAGELSLHGLNSHFSTTEDFVGHCQASFNEEKSLVEVRDDLLSCGVLVLDDLGVERRTDFAMAQVDALVDQAYRDERPMLIITSNLTLNEVADYLPRVADRIAETCHVLRIDGISRRLSKSSWNGDYELFYRENEKPFDQPITVHMKLAELMSRSEGRR
jgi:DNA replication protein DnaC